MLINNAGAAVFDYLPIAREADVYEQHVATPTGLDFERAAALYGFRHERPQSLEALRALLVQPAGQTLIEVRTDRSAGVALHERVWSAAAVAPAVPRGQTRRAIRPPSTGSSAPSLTSVSASSAAGSESATTPLPA